MSGFAFKIEGLTETLSKFNSLPDEVKQAVDDELTATAEQIASDARILAPKDFGKLSGTDDLKLTRNEPLLKQVSALADYAAYVEFGTGSKVRITPGIPGLEAYAYQFFVNGKGYLPARPFFFPAYLEATKDLIKRLKVIIEETAKK